MRHMNDDFDDFEFDDDAIVNKFLREQSREERRYGHRKHHSAGHPRDYDDYDDFSDDDDFEDYDDDDFDGDDDLDIEH